MTHDLDALVRKVAEIKIRREDAERARMRAEAEAISRGEERCQVLRGLLGPWIERHARDASDRFARLLKSGEWAALAKAEHDLRGRGSTGLGILVRPAVVTRDAEIARALKRIVHEVDANDYQAWVSLGPILRVERRKRVMWFGTRADMGTFGSLGALADAAIKPAGSHPASGVASWIAQTIYLFAAAQLVDLVVTGRLISILVTVLQRDALRLGYR